MPIATEFGAVMFILAAVEGEATTYPATIPWVLVGVAVTWASIWIQVASKFFFKGEELHKDYHTNGALNSARSAIESNSLIPALVQMFDRALEGRGDRRRNPNMAELLTAVQFLPDFESAQAAMGNIQKLDQQYDELKAKASWIWKWTALHALITPLPVGLFVVAGFAPTWSLATLCVLLIAWGFTLGVSVTYCTKFHSLMGQFNKDIETHGREAQ